MRWLVRWLVDGTVGRWHGGRYGGGGGAQLSKSDNACVASRLDLSRQDTQARPPIEETIEGCRRVR